METHLASDRRRAGGVTGKVVLALLLASGYAAYQYGPGYFAQGTLRRAVEQALTEAGHETTDDYLRSRIAKRARVAGIPVDEAAIGIRRESREGQRLAHVEVPGESGALQLTHVWPVDEAVEARKAEERRKQEEWDREYARISEEEDRKVRAALAECRKHFRDCRVETTYVPRAPGNRPIDMFTPRD